MATEEILWGRLGEPMLRYMSDWLFTLDGTPAGYIERDGAVYNLKGLHVGWLRGGLLRDKYGYCLATKEIVRDPIHPPLPPLKHHRHIPNTQLHLPGLPPQAGIASPPPVPRYSWSSENVKELLPQAESALSQRRSASYSASFIRAIRR